MSLLGRSFLAGFLAGSAAFAGYYLTKKKLSSASNKEASALPPQQQQQQPQQRDPSGKPHVHSVVGVADERPNVDGSSSQVARMLQFENAAQMLRGMDTTGEKNKGGKRWNYNWDNRQPEHVVPPIREGDLSLASIEWRLAQIRAAAPRTTRFIVLVRHGQYEDQEINDEDRHLTALGKEQAAMTGKRLGVLLSGLEQQLRMEEQAPLELKLVRSTMTRAQETAEIILGELGRNEIEVENCDLIREGAPIPPIPSLGDWDPVPREIYQEGCRIEAGFRTRIHRMNPAAVANRVDVLVCHGNVIRYFVCRALQLPPDAWLRFNLAHASITTLYIRPSGRVGITTYGEAGHLPAAKVTY